MSLVSEKTSAEAMAQELFDIRKGRAREDELKKSLRKELSGRRSACFGKFRLTLKGKGYQKALNQERAIAHVGREHWASFYDVKPCELALHVTKSGQTPKRSAQKEADNDGGAK